MQLVSVVFWLASRVRKVNSLLSKLCKLANNQLWRVFTILTGAIEKANWNDTGKFIAVPNGIFFAYPHWMISLLTLYLLN